MLPEAWLPTWTVVTAWTVPVVATASMMSPREISAVCTIGAASARASRYAWVPMPAAPSRPMAAATRLILITSPFPSRFVGRNGCDQTVAEP